MRRNTLERRECDNKQIELLRAQPGGDLAEHVGLLGDLVLSGGLVLVDLVQGCDQFRNTCLVEGAHLEKQSL